MKYDAVVKNTCLFLQSGLDTVHGLQFEKRFYASGRDTSIRIQYRIISRSKSSRWLALWEVTRVPAGGLSFFPKGYGIALQKSNLIVQAKAGIIWYPYDSTTIFSNQKMFMDGKEGWLAHVKNGIIFIKQFPDMLPSGAAPG